MEMTRIILSKNEGGSFSSRVNMLKVCSKFKVRTVKITEQRNNFVLHCLNNNEAEKIFSDTAMNALKNIGVEAKLPWSLKAARTVIIRKLSDEILNCSLDELTDEIHHHNSSLKIYSMWKNEHILKITFSTIQMAQNTLEYGLSMFYLHIPKFHIERDVPVDVTICDYCFAFENHRSSDCPERSVDPLFQTCSLCAVVGHHFS